MALMHGKSGMVNWSSSDIGDATSWSMDSTADMAETTAFDDAGVATYAAGVTRWNASAEAFHTDGGPAATAGQSATLNLELADGGDKYTGTALCAGRSVRCGVDGQATITYTWQGTGTLTDPS